MDRVLDVDIERRVCCRQGIHTAAMVQYVSAFARKSLNAAVRLVYLLMMPYALMAFGYFLAVPAASFPSACILTYTWHASFTVDNKQLGRIKQFLPWGQCRQACSAHA